MKKYFLTLLFFTTTILFAQEEKTATLVEKKMWKINFLVPGISYEYGLGDRTTLYSSLNIMPAYEDFKQLKTWTVAPNIQEELRCYYNLQKQPQKNKNAGKNTGGYFSLLAIYGLQPFGKSDSYTKIDGLTLAPTWGVQYTHKSGFNMGVNIGYGYNFSAHQSVNGGKFVNNLTIGWVLK